MQALDYRLFQAINGLAGRNTLADSLMKAIAGLGPYVLMGILALIWFLPRPTAPRGEERRVILYALLVAAAGLGVNQVIGHIWARPRPGIGHVTTQLLGGSTDPSFPSDHATLAFGLAVPVLLVLYRWGLLLFGCALLIGLARVYVGRHYPGDILGSLVVSVAVTACVWAARGRLERVIVPLLAVLARLRLASIGDAALPIPRAVRP
jgi:undecaprenyl-diphosphatase